MYGTEWLILCYCAVKKLFTHLNLLAAFIGPTSKGNDGNIRKRKKGKEKRDRGKKAKGNFAKFITIGMPQPPLLSKTVCMLHKPRSE